MKKMKISILFLTVLMMVLLMTACGNNNNDTTSGSSAPQTNQSSSESSGGSGMSEGNGRNRICDSIICEYVLQFKNRAVGQNLY